MSSYVVVGASKGLGFEWLRQLSQDKSNTIFGLVRVTKTVQAKLDAEKITGVKLLAGDMENAKSLEAAASEVSLITGGKLDVLIVNGAYMTFDTWHYYPSEFAGKEDILMQEVLKSAEVNLVGTIYSVNSFLPLIRAGRDKKIVSITSGHADLDLILAGGISVSAVYSAIKSATNVMIGKFAAELKPEGIKSLSMSPGSVDTDQPTFTAEQLPQGMEMAGQFQSQYPEWKGNITADQSIKMQKNVIDNLTIEQSVSHYGTKQWL